jgi:cell division protein FtsB
MPKFDLKKQIRKILRSPKLLLIAATILVLGATLLFANKGIWRHVILRQEVASLNERSTKLDVEEKTLQGRVGLLEKGDEALIERIARERYHMKKRGEIIYRLKEQ